MRAMALLAAFAAALASEGSAQAFERSFCSWCHGESGQGYATAPRLAGQTSQYIESQLRRFHAHARTGPLMWGATTGFSVQSAHDIAVYFSAISPKAADDGNAALVPTGRAIFQDGIPDSDVVGCAACHGPAAEGAGEVPRLGGLSYYYVQARLEHWRQGHDTGASPPMPRVARQLSSNEIKALASYLSSMP